MNDSRRGFASLLIVLMIVVTIAAIAATAVIESQGHAIPNVVIHPALVTPTLNCGTSTFTIDPTYGATWRAVGSDTLPTYQLLNADRALSCIGANMLTNCTSSAIMVNERYYGPILYRIDPTNDTCTIQITVGDADQIQTTFRKNYANHLFTCSVPNVERYFTSQYDVDNGLFMGLRFDHAQPGSYASDLILTLTYDVLESSDANVPCTPPSSY